MKSHRFQLTYFHKLLIGAGVVGLLVAIWNFEGTLTPVTSHYTTPDWASQTDQRLLAGARHVAPLAHKKWVEDQIKAEMEAPQKASVEAPFGQPHYSPPPETAPAPGYREQAAGMYQSTPDGSRVRMVVQR